MLDTDWEPQDEALYRAVIAFPRTDEQGLADELGWPLADVVASMVRLRATGLIHVGNDGLPVASPPELALAPRLARSREQLRRAEELAAELAETYHRETALGSGLELVEVVEGEETLAHRLLQLEYSAKTRVRAFQSGANMVITPESTVPSASETDDDDESLSHVRRHGRHGVHYQFLVDSDFLREPAAVVYLEQRLAEGDEVRVSDDPLRKLAIADDDVAMVQLGEHTTVMLRRPLADLVGELFDTRWHLARPYGTEAADLAPLDRQILALMIAGLTDEALAGQLSVSPRTVQRRVRDLMDRTGSTSRMHLGWLAARRGWV